LSLSIKDNFGFYGILSDPVAGYEKLTCLMVERKTRFIQLRMKNHPKDEVLNTAIKLRPLIKSPSLFIVNDDPEIALAAGADGVHLGQEDGPVDHARKILGAEAIIGLSTHNAAQVKEACPSQVSYIGVGPVFPPESKKDPDPIIHIEGMQKMLAIAAVPAVAIGGIRVANLPEVLRAGATNFTAVGSINRSPDPAPEIDKLLNVYNQHSWVHPEKPQTK